MRIAAALCKLAGSLTVLVVFGFICMVTFSGWGHLAAEVFQSGQQAVTPWLVTGQQIARPWLRSLQQPVYLLDRNGAYVLDKHGRPLAAS